MTDDAPAREMRQWEAADLSVPLDAVPCPRCGGTGRVVETGTTAEGVEFCTEGPCRCRVTVDVPNATANASTADAELEAMVAITPCICKACAEWDPWRNAYGEPMQEFGTCQYQATLRQPLDAMWALNEHGVRTLPGFGCNRWREKDAPSG
jgi:hypothetical protein